MKTVSPMLAILLLLLLAAETDAGGNKNAGKFAAPELLIPVGARYIGLGGSAVASAAGVEAIPWNPAGLARCRSRASALFSHTPYFADINVEYAALAANIANLGSFALNLKVLSFGDIVVTTKDEKLTDRTISPNFLTFGVTYARLLTPRFAAGANMKVVYENIEPLSGTSVALDLGVQYTDLAGIKGLNVGVAVKNVGASFNFEGTLEAAGRKVKTASDNLPTSLDLGAGYALAVGPAGKFNLSGCFRLNNYADHEIALGTEYGYKDLVFLRGGYRLAPGADKDAHIYGLTLGGGLHHHLGQVNLAIDYAYQSIDFLEAGSILTNGDLFTIRLGF